MGLIDGLVFCPLSEGVCHLPTGGFPIPWTDKHSWGTLPAFGGTWIHFGVRVFRSTLSISAIWLFSGFRLPLGNADTATVDSHLRLSGDQVLAGNNGIWRSGRQRKAIFFLVVLQHPSQSD